MHDENPFDPPEIKDALKLIMTRGGEVSADDLSDDVLEWLDDHRYSTVLPADGGGLRVILNEDGWQDAYSRCRDALTLGTMRPQDRGMAERVIAFVERELPEAQEIWFSGERARGEHGPNSEWEFVVLFGYSENRVDTRTMTPTTAI